jgi:hypothetical protein
VIAKSHFKNNQFIEKKGTDFKNEKEGMSFKD